MADIIKFPTKRALPKISPAPISIEATRRKRESAEQATARTLDDSAFAPYYGTPDSDSKMIPFYAYTNLSATAQTTSITLPDKTKYLIDHPKDAQDLLWGAHLSACIITEAHWSGGDQNLPWRGIEDPIGYARSSILSICVRLREGGCDTRILKKLPIKLHARSNPIAANASQLALCFTARRRIELVQSGSVQ